MRRFRNMAQRAVTLTELLVVLVIISLLATIAVPTYIQKIQQARVTVALAETQTIAEALQACAVVHGFVVPLRVLDNVPNDSSIVADDFLDANISTGCSVIDAYIPVETQASSSQLTFASSDARVSNMVNRWQGPFIEYKRFYNPSGTTTNLTALTRAEMAQDYPLDPWGRPYILFARTGIVGSYQPGGGPAPGPTTSLSNTVDNGVLSSTEADRFDRWAVLSLGPNGYSDQNASSSTGALTVDDIYHEFSITIENESAYSLF
jgi:prepilin-type N-terminal cleavage/methylation domain-containing protein